MPRFGTALPSACRPPKTARPRHSRPTRRYNMVFGERTGLNTKLGDRGASKGALPDPRYGEGTVKTWKSQCDTAAHYLCMNVITYCCTGTCYCASVHGGWVGCCTCRCCSAVVVPRPPYTAARRSSPTERAQPKRIRRSKGTSRPRSPKWRGS